MFYRFGHINPTKGMKVGDKIKIGQQVGGNGTGNGQWSAHCHFDIIKQSLNAWTDYVIGLPKESVEIIYADPRGLEKKVLPTFDHLGYGWLEDAQYTGGHAFHPGLDLNGQGSGDADFGDPIHCPVDGTVVYVNFTGANHGWGGLVVVEESLKEDPMKKEFVEAVEELVGKDYGDNLNEKEQEDAAKRLKEKREIIKAQDAKILDLNDETRELEESFKNQGLLVTELQEKLRDAEAKLAQMQEDESGSAEANEIWDAIKKVAQAIKNSLK